MNNPKTIYLQPYCEKCFPDGISVCDDYWNCEGRQWSEDADVWDEFESNCDKCDAEMKVAEYKLVEGE